MTSNNGNGSATDTQSVIRAIPIPNTRTFSPAEGEALTRKMPSFSWTAVDAEKPLFYRLEIKDMGDKHIYRTNYVEDMLSIRLPPDLLKVGQTYRWRVRIADGANWITLNNRSHSQWLPFSVGQTHRQCEYAYQVPEKTDDGWDTSSLTA